MIRIVIYPSDIVLITNKSESYGRKMIQIIKKSLNKAKHQLLTIKEYCDYCGLNVDVIIAFLSKYEFKKAY